MYEAVLSKGKLVKVSLSKTEKQQRVQTITKSRG